MLECWNAEMPNAACPFPIRMARGLLVLASLPAVLNHLTT